AQTGIIAPTSRPAWGGGQALVQLGRFLVPIAALLLIWEVAVRGGWIAANIFPAPSMVFARASELIFSTGPDRGMLLTHIAASLFGFLLGLLPRVYKWLSPILSLMLPLPAVAWTPILLVAFGQGDRTIITVCFLGAFFPVLYSTIQGVRSVSRQSIWVIQSMG